jgi:palmitoyltransferase
LAAFFGLFTFGMTTVSLQYIFLNLTNVEIIRQKSMVHQLAIRVPQHTEPAPYLHIVTYPLQEPGNAVTSSNSSSRHDNPLSARDQLATRKFAVVRTQMGENPWDLGPYNNWKSVMGTNMLDWLLPIRKSPCVYEENNESFYKMGPLHGELRARYSLPRVVDGHEDRGYELRGM